MRKRELFDKNYYDHFYGRGRERRAYQRDEDLLGDFVCAYIKYLEQPVRRVVDIGCGFGWWRDIIASHFPKASYTGIEYSEYLCEKYGWVRSSVVDFQSKYPFDLVICKDTLQYLSGKDFQVAIDNLADLCRGVLYLSVLTTEDWEENCDPDRTDANVYLRPGSWYRRILNRHFINLGGGVLLSPRSRSIPWEIEKLSK